MILVRVRDCYGDPPYVGKYGVLRKKYYVNNYPGNELFVIYKQISNYLKNGEEIN